jgi:hypothetical protein
MYTGHIELCPNFIEHVYTPIAAPWSSMSITDIIATDHDYMSLRAQFLYSRKSSHEDMESPDWFQIARNKCKHFSPRAKFDLSLCVI